MLPKGAPMFVTKLIIAKMKHMVIIATRLVFLLVLIVKFAIYEFTIYNSILSRSYANHR